MTHHDPLLLSTLSEVSPQCQGFSMKILHSDRLKFQNLVAFHEPPGSCYFGTWQSYPVYVQLNIQPRLREIPEVPFCSLFHSAIHLHNSNYQLWISVSSVQQESMLSLGSHSMDYSPESASRHKASVITGLTLFVSLLCHIIF